MEFYDNSVFLAHGPFKVAGDVLVLAGDTLLLKDLDTYRKHRFFDWCSNNYRETLLIPGNHEYYRDDVANYPDSWEMELRPNVRMMENRSVVVDKTEFILSTLWSYIPMNSWLKLKAGMSDFHLIHYGGKPLTATTYNALHERDLAFIKAAVSASKAEHRVVVTHHVPSCLLVAPEFKNSSMESGFTVDLTEYIEGSGIDVWVYGHSHRTIETVIGKTRMVSNQIGYVAYGEYRNNFRGDRFVDLGREPVR
jgi:predicted phosphodiesterase